MKTVKELTPFVSTVQPEQIGRAHKILAKDGNFYKVQSSRDTTVEYTVRYTVGKGFTCTCPSGQVGFSNCSKLGVCQHVLIAMACEREMEQALEEMAAATCAPTAPVSYPTVDQATMARIEAANERAANKPTPRAKAPEPRGFSLLK